MSRVKLRLVARVKRLGWPAQLGFALIGIAMVIQFAIYAPMQSRAVQLQREAAAIRKNAEHAVQNGNGKRGDVRSIDVRFSEFYQYFPSRQSIPDWLDNIYSAAHDQAIVLQQGEYKLVPGKTEKLLGYQISLPVTGTYSQLRKFVVQVLKVVPTAALDEISFKRETIGGAEVEAKIKMTVYLRPE